MPPAWRLLQRGSHRFRAALHEELGRRGLGNNLTDEKYWTTVLGSGFGDHGELRPPRTYGVHLRLITDGLGTPA